MIWCEKDTKTPILTPPKDTWDILLFYVSTLSTIPLDRLSEPSIHFFGTTASTWRSSNATTSHESPPWIQRFELWNSQLLCTANSLFWHAHMTLLHCPTVSQARSLKSSCSTADWEAFPLENSPLYFSVGEFLASHAAQKLFAVYWKSWTWYYLFLFEACYLTSTLWMLTKYKVLVHITCI